MNVLLAPMSSRGYLYPAIAVGRRLREQGHRVFALVEPAMADTVTAADLIAINTDELGEPNALAISGWMINGPRQDRVVRRAIAAVDADTLVTSVLCLGVLSAAEARELPVTVLGLAAHLWAYRAGTDHDPALAEARINRERHLLGHFEATRSEGGLTARSEAELRSALAGTVCYLRGDPAMEAPGALLPDNVRHAGPCGWEPVADPEVLDLIDDRLARNGKPVVYIHLGRKFGGESLWPRLNAAFTNGPYQAIVECGRSGRPEIARGADIVAVRQPWLTPLVDRAEAVLTSTTSTPVLAALTQAKPLLLAPAGSEQPLLAGACVRLGVGLRWPVEREAAVRAFSAAEQLRTTVDAVAERLRASGGADLVAAQVRDLATEGSTR